MPSSRTRSTPCSVRAMTSSYIRGIARFPLIVAGALTLVVASGCGAASHRATVVKPAGKFPIVVAHPKVQFTGDPRELRGHGAVLRPSSQVVFGTSGTVSCAWLPARLTVLGPSAVRIDMRVNGRVSTCGSGSAGFPIAVTIPRMIDIHRPLSVRLAYKVRLPGGGGTQRWKRTVVAPALKS